MPLSSILASATTTGLNNNMLFAIASTTSNYSTSTLFSIANTGKVTVLMITHKFREVMAYADGVTVLRRGKAVHHGRVADTSPALLAATMMGAQQTAAAPAQAETLAKLKAELARLKSEYKDDDRFADKLPPGGVDGPMKPGPRVPK